MHAAQTYQLTVLIESQPGDVISDNADTESGNARFQHGQIGLATCRGECCRNEMLCSLALTRDAHDEHVLRHPTCNRQCCSVVSESHHHAKGACFKPHPPSSLAKHEAIRRAKHFLPSNELPPYPLPNDQISYINLHKTYLFPTKLAFSDGR